MTDNSDQISCPLCGGDNRCGNVAGLPLGTCWCTHAHFPKELFAEVPEELLRKACVCQACLTRFQTERTSE